MCRSGFFRNLIIALPLLFIGIAMAQEAPQPRTTTIRQAPVTFSAGAPLASIITPQTDLEIAVSASVDFSGYATEGEPPYTYHWDFGGGAENSIENAPGEIVFNTKGIYDITFSIEDSFEAASSDYVTIYVGIPMDPENNEDGGGGSGCFIGTITVLIP